MLKNKLDVDKYNISLLTIGSPVSINNGYNLKILYNMKEFVIQTPLCKVLEVDMKAKKPYINIAFPLSKNFAYFQFFGGLNQDIMDALETYSKREDYDILKKMKIDPESESDNPLEDNFDSSSERTNDSTMVIKIKLKKETMYFNKDKNEMSGLEIKEGDKVIGLLQNKGVFVDQYNANFRWTASQMLKFV